MDILFARIAGQILVATIVLNSFILGPQCGNAFYSEKFIHAFPKRCRFWVFGCWVESILPT